MEVGDFELGSRCRRDGIIHAAVLTQISHTQIIKAILWAIEEKFMINLIANAEDRSFTRESYLNQEVLVFDH